MDIELKPIKMARYILMLVVGFTFAHIIGQLTEIYMGRNIMLPLFDLSREQSIQRFFSSVMLLLCSGLLYTIAAAKKGDNTHNFHYWLGLVFIFLYLSITKITSLHEDLAVLIRSALNMSKIQFYAWAYGIVVVMFLVIYLKFFLDLPKKTMVLMVIGGSAFIVGAFGLDLVVAYLGKSIDHHTMVYIGLVTLEDVLEMVGIVIFMYALFLYMDSELKWIRVRIADQGN